MLLDARRTRHWLSLYPAAGLTLLSMPQQRFRALVGIYYVLKQPDKREKCGGVTMLRYCARYGEGSNLALTFSNRRQQHYVDCCCVSDVPVSPHSRVGLPPLSPPELSRGVVGSILYQPTPPTLRDFSSLPAVGKERRGNEQLGSLTHTHFHCNLIREGLTSCLPNPTYKASASQIGIATLLFISEYCNLLTLCTSLELCVSYLISLYTGAISSLCN